MATLYDVTVIAVRPGTHRQALAVLEKSLPKDPALLASVTGAVTRFLHVWPYKSVDERARLREKAVAGGLWPPPGGPGHLLSQQAGIHQPAPFPAMT